MGASLTAPPGPEVSRALTRAATSAPWAHPLAGLLFAVILTAVLLVAVREGPGGPPGVAAYRSRDPECSYEDRVFSR